MIDYIALSIGHGLIAVALLRLFMRKDVDFDPLIEGMRDEMRQNRMAASTAGRNAKRRAETDPEPDGNADKAVPAKGRRRR